MFWSGRGLLSLDLEGGDFDTARAVLARDARSGRSPRQPVDVGILTMDSTHLALLEGDLAGARARLQEILIEVQEIGNANAIAEISLRAARVARHAGDIDEAIELLAESACIFSSEGDDGGIAHVLTERGVIAGCTGDHVGAALLLGGASGVRDRLGIATPGSEAGDIDRTRRAATAALGAEEAERLWRQGHDSSVESLPISL